ncbi:ADP-glyceromanno-heptose 6-epimerase [Desulfonatronovibrio hydrogenovorans]|uniref:ADP-glyceromanno-heptose 6-epimerase n=1 Tax=Desulfonatronovibrio hydrogenovorans TaxID=53245 RepID=UPI0004901BB4|nr:ADP-glyceromanno-heptose 6-epimerase [Desulfonatronovibrio hydrogenovorans]
MHIVTGGAGFIGSGFVYRLNQMGLDDILIVDNLGSTEKWKNLVNLRYRDYIHKDEFLAKLEKGFFPYVESVIHMGACSSTTEKDADYLMSNNFHYSKRLARFCRESSARFIYASSAATYGDGELGFNDDHATMTDLRPLNMYGYSKQLFDLWVKRKGLLDHVVGLKFFNVFGPNEYHKEDMQSVVRKAYFQIKETGRVRLFKSYHPQFGHGEQKRDFVYLKDCLEVMAWFLEKKDVNGIFNLGYGRARTWNDLAKAVFQAMDLEPEIEYMDMPETLRGKYQYYTCAPMDKLEQAGCPVAFHSLEDGVRDYVQNYLSRNDPYL